VRAAIDDNTVASATEQERAPINMARDEGNRAEAAKELAAFRAAHLDHEKLLPPDLRNWRPAEK